MVPNLHDHAPLLADGHLPTASLLFHLRTSVRIERVDRSAPTIASTLDNRCCYGLDNYSAILVRLGDEIPGIAVLILDGGCRSLQAIRKAEPIAHAGVVKRQ